MDYNTVFSQRLDHLIDFSEELSNNQQIEKFLEDINGHINKLNSDPALVKKLLTLSSKVLTKTDSTDLGDRINEVAGKIGVTSTEAKARPSQEAMIRQEELIKTARRSGDPKQLFSVGMECEGDNIEEAISLYRRSARDEYKPAMHALDRIAAQLFKEGSEEKNISKAIKCYSLSASQGYQAAMRALNEIKKHSKISNFSTVKKEFNTAIDRKLDHSIAKAIESNDTEKLYKMGIKCENEDRPEKAVEVYILAAEKGHEPSMIELEKTYAQDVPNLTKTRRRFNNARNLQLNKIIANAKKSHQPGDLFNAGVECEEMKKYDKAIELFSIGARQGHKPSMDVLDDLKSKHQIKDLESIRTEFSQRYIRS